MCSSDLKMTVQELKQDRDFQESITKDKSLKDFVDEMDNIINALENNLNEIKELAKAKGIEPELI